MFRVRAGLVAAITGLLALLGAPPGAHAASFTHSAVVERDGNPTLIVDGKPFFFYGAAFFYERIPPAQWERSMRELADMGFNTLDLYVPWNWHEVSDGDFDFGGRTSPRRNLREVIRLGAQLGFHFIVRPGPVIRNEWRNGGYPAWLLQRPEYAMPLHDVLEGRYPATATLQNAHSDDAAAEWLQNATHMRYATRWLQTALREFAPVADRVLAVQLDDDQGAYIDNQTWPAPNLQAYLKALERITRTVTGPVLPVFINTYEMKVTASSPVWAMGNWYQSDAYAIGEHDRTALEFSTALLQTQPHWPVAISEFQAGWLAAPEDPAPRPADPSNTTLALHTMLGFGARGIIDFPPQDTVNPAGWEAPFANASYAWDAALGTELQHSARYAPTAAMGDLVRRFGSELAGARRVADGAIAYTVSAYPLESIDNAAVFSILARTQSAQRACRDAHLTCDLVDIRFAADDVLARYAFIIVPPRSDVAMEAAVAAKLDRFRRHGGRTLLDPPHLARLAAGGLPDATVLAGSNAAFLDIVNYDSIARYVPATRIPRPHGGAWILAARTIAARAAELIRLDTSAPEAPARSGQAYGTEAPAVIPGASPPGAHLGPVTIREFAADDGFDRVTLNAQTLEATVSLAAGGRLTALTFRGMNAVTSVGALRDDVEIQPPLSTTDRIGKYTRSFPAGMFNRDYHVIATTATSTRVAYDAPDVVPAGARFERTFSIEQQPAERLIVDESVRFGAGPGADRQRSVTYSSFDTRGAQTIDDRAQAAVGFFNPAKGAVTTYAWRPGDVEDAQLVPERSSAVVRLRFAAGGMRRCSIAVVPASTLDDARAALRKEETAIAANR